MTVLPKLTFVLGGARSGKSAFAEQLAVSSGLALTYVATATAGDHEMSRRIAAHQARRGREWALIEAPGKIMLPPGLSGVVLLDCLTLYLANRMSEGEGDLELWLRQLLETFQDVPARIIVVSSEVGLGLVPGTALGRDYRDALGEINQAVAAKSDLAVLVVAGLPLVLKGRLP